MGRPGLMRHRKFARLQRLLECPNSKFVARGVLEVVWEAAYENGDELLGDELDLEALVGWEGEPKALASALVQSGFLDETVEGLAVHDLWDHAPDYVRRRAEREGERRKKGQSLSDVRAEAGRAGGLAKASKRNSLATPGPGKPLANVSTRAPAPARAPARNCLSVADAPVATDSQRVESRPSPEAVPPSKPRAQKQQKPHMPSAQEQIAQALAATRTRIHPDLTPWPTSEARFIKVVNKVFASGSDIRTAHDADPKLFQAAWERYLADPWWKANGGWPLTGFLAKWREHLDSAKATQPSASFRNAIRPGEAFPDPYAEEETDHG